MNAPFQTYPGGKNADGVYQALINEITPHDVYCELFLGNGSVLRHKKTAQFNFGIDCDNEVIQKWLTGVPNNISILQGDSIEFVKYFWMLASAFNKVGLRIFIFVDPPYLMDSRKSNRKIYNNELTEHDHVVLLSGLNRLSVFCNIMITNYDHSLYNQMLPGWRKKEFSGQTRSGRVIDYMWMNYDTPDQLHDYSYLGENFRERERINGIVQRNTAKFLRMPDLERNKLIENLKNQNLI